MIDINWVELEEQFGSKYKDYAPAGTYKVKIGKVEHRASSTGTVWEEFKPDDSEKYSFPKISHPLTAKTEPKSVNWRRYHWRELFILFGATKDQAQKAVALCEDHDTFEQIAEAYLGSMNKLISKKPEVEIEVWEDGDYSRADFTSSIRMSKPKDKKENALDGAIELTEEEASDVPF